MLLVSKIKYWPLILVGIKGGFSKRHLGIYPSYTILTELGQEGSGTSPPPLLDEIKSGRAIIGQVCLSSKQLSDTPLEYLPEASLQSACPADAGLRSFLLTVCYIFSAFHVKTTIHRWWTEYRPSTFKLVPGVYMYDAYDSDSKVDIVSSHCHEEVVAPT